MDSSFNLAVHALVCLSHSGRSLSSEALAENICTNPTRVRRVQAVLKKAGIVETREGLDGGYPGNAGAVRAWLQSSRSLIIQPEQRRADFLKLCDAITVKPLVTRYTTHKNTAAEYICGCVLCSVAHCCVDWIWRTTYLPILHGFLICHHSGSLPCRYVGIPTAVVSGLTLNMAFSIYLPYRFSAIYFSAMWTATAPSATAVTT